jgi:phosphoglycolate phosphatase-like HAD superfamily hydrolase
VSSHPSRSCWAFDIDGVLIDSRELVEQAYLNAGVALPEEAWGVSWRRWLIDLVGSEEEALEVHRRKQESYATLLRIRGSAYALPGAALANALIDVNADVYFVTAASRASALQVLTVLDLPEERLVGTELTTEQRMDLLRDIKTTNESRSYTYIDDRLEGQRIAQDAGWGFGHALWML